MGDLCHVLGVSIQHLQYPIAELRSRRTPAVLNVADMRGQIVAHGLTAGLGRTQGPAATRAFVHSRALAASTAARLTQDNGIDHDNVMRIGR